MRSVAEFAYAQARIEARHGERLEDAGWKTLDSAQSLSRYLERARSTSLKRFLAPISLDLSAHAIDGVLRREAALYVGEIAAWAPRRWQPAIAWLAALPLLPLVGGLRGDASPPDWVGEDAALATLAAAGSDAPANAAGLVRFVGTSGAPSDVGRRWLRRWRALWPQGDPANVDLARLVSQALRALGSPSRVQEATGGQSFRRDLDGVLTRFFRSHVASPVALVSHVGLVLIDLERLRGGLARRSLFAAEEERIAT
ncbi:MAG TPA: hypothetical protein VK446_01330 [Methylocystis sp.]|nr:hypothetical protein [Methylocystis sp.]